MKKKTAARIDRAFDRFSEAHFWLHTMEDTYHRADAFRWSLNAFITTLIAVPDLVQKASDEAQVTISEAKEEIIKDAAFSKLKTYRNDIVHNHGLIIDSSGSITLYDSRTIRFSFSAPIDPSMDSDIAIINYLKTGDPFGIMKPDEDNYPAVYREWKSSKFDDDILTVCRHSLILLSNFMHKVSQLLFDDYSNQKNSFSLECCKPLKEIKIKGYNRDDLMKSLCPHYPN